MTWYVIRLESNLSFSSVEVARSDWGYRLQYIVVTCRYLDIFWPKIAKNKSKCSVSCALPIPFGMRDVMNVIKLYLVYFVQDYTARCSHILLASRFSEKIRSSATRNIANTITRSTVRSDGKFHFPTNNFYLFPS